jgi:hypothetical protein
MPGGWLFLARQLAAGGRLADAWRMRCGALWLQQEQHLRSGGCLGRREFYDENIWAAGSLGDERIWAAGSFGDEKIWAAGSFGDEKIWAAGSFGDGKIWAAGSSGDGKIWAAGSCGDEKIFAAGRESVRPSRAGCLRNH